MKNNNMVVILLIFLVNYLYNTFSLKIVDRSHYYHHPEMFLTVVLDQSLLMF